VPHVLERGGKARQISGVDGLRLENVASTVEKNGKDKFLLRMTIIFTGCV